MQKDRLEEIKTLFSRHMEAFQRELSTLVSTPGPEDERQIQEAISEVLEQQDQKATGLGVLLAEQMEATAERTMALADSQEKKDRLLEVLSRHLRIQILEISQILTSDLR